MTGYAWYLSQCLRPNPGIYLPLAGGTMQGAIDMAGNKIEDLPDPAANQEADTQAARNAAIAIHGAGHITIIPTSYASIGQGVWTFAPETSGLLQLRQINPSQTNGDNISWNVYLAKGTYTIKLCTYTHSNAPIIDIDIDGTEVFSFDLYAAVGTFNVFQTQAGIVIPAANLYALKWRVHGKNPLSGNYRSHLFYIALWRTS